MSLIVKEISVTPGAAYTCMRFEVSAAFDISDDLAVTALLSNGTPFNMSIDKMLEICSGLDDSSSVLIHDRETNQTRVFNYE